MGKEELESSRCFDQVVFKGPMWLGGRCGSDGWIADEDLFMGQVKDKFVPDEMMVGGH